MNVHSGSSTGTLEWQEDHSVVTNQFGLFDLIVGQGTSTGGGLQPSFSDISWSANKHFLNVKVDTGGGFGDLGTMQFMSVPYSMHSATADSAASSATTLQGAYDNGNTIQLDGTSPFEIKNNASVYQFGVNNAGNLGIGTSPLASQKLRIAGGTLSNAVSLYNSSTQPSLIAQNNSSGPAGQFVNSSGGVPLRAIYQGSGGGYFEFLHNNSSTLLKMGSNGSYGLFGTSSNHNLSLMANGNPVMHLTPGGDVGIGVATPSQKLDVDNGGSVEVDGAYYYESPKTRYYSISPADFGTSVEPDVYHVDFVSSGGYMKLEEGATGSDGYALAPVHLPHGATVTRFLTAIVDNDGGQDTEAILYRKPRGGGATYEMAKTTTSDAYNSGLATNNDYTINYATINNVNYNYYMRVKLDRNSNTTLYRGAVIYYEVDKAD